MVVAPGTAGVVRWAQQDGYDERSSAASTTPGSAVPGRSQGDGRHSAGRGVPARRIDPGERVSILVGRRKWIPEMHENVSGTGSATACRIPDAGHERGRVPAGSTVTEKRIIEEACGCRGRRGGLVVLGCTIEFGFYRQVQQSSASRSVDALVAPLRFAEFLADLRRDHGWAHSKVLGYEAPPQDELDAWVPAVEPLIDRGPRPSARRANCSRHETLPVGSTHRRQRRSG